MSETIVHCYQHNGANMFNVPRLVQRDFHSLMKKYDIQLQVVHETTESITYAHSIDANRDDVARIYCVLDTLIFVSNKNRYGD